MTKKKAEPKKTTTSAAKPNGGKGNTTNGRTVRKRAEVKSSTRSTTRGGTASRSKTSGRTSRTTTQRKKPSGGIRELPRPQLKRPQINVNLDPRRKALGGGLAIVLIAILLLLSQLSTNRGVITGGLLNVFWTGFGWGAPLVLLALAFSGLSLVMWGMERPIRLAPVRVLGGLLLFFVFEAFASMIAVMQSNPLDSLEAVAAARVGGGALGGILANVTLSFAGTFGAIFIFLFIGLFGAALVSGLRREHFASPATPQTRPLQSALALAEPPPVEETAEAAAEKVEPWIEPQGPERSTTPTAAPERESKGRIRLGRRKPEPLPEPPHVPAPPEPIFLGREAQLSSWELPVLSQLLHSGSDQDVSDAFVVDQQRIIEETLSSFGAPGKVVEINKGPTIVQYGVEPQFIIQRSGKRTKVKVGKIASLADDLALALAARSVRIQAPVPGKGYVGIEVPNEGSALVSLRDVMESEAFDKLSKKSPLVIGLGQDVSGQPMVTDLTKMPHLLIAGATGSGKSVCVNALIAALLLTNTPEDLQLVMVDPKRVELTGYNGIPHLAAPVVVDIDRVVGTLQWALREMDNRYKLFADIGARNIADCNRRLIKDGKRKLPYIVIIIDELADLMMLAPEDTERGITRLAQMARATGIHMVIATQRPSVDVVTGLIKANFPARIAFAVASSTDSRVVLDSTGAERLLGQGDMLFQSPDAPAPVRMQGCFVSDAELEALISYWKLARRRGHQERMQNIITASTDAIKKSELENWDLPEVEAPKTAEVVAQPTTNGRVVRKPTPANQETAAPLPPLAKPTQPPKREVPVQKQPPLWEELREQIEEEQEKALQPDHPVDDLYEEAVEMVRELGKASTSLLQRRFRIGYTRAARLIDAMEEQGVIGPPTGTSKAREVVDAEEDEANEQEEGAETAEEAAD